SSLWSFQSAGRARHITSRINLMLTLSSLSRSEHGYSQNYDGQRSAGEVPAYTTGICLPTGSAVGATRTHWRPGIQGQGRAAPVSRRQHSGVAGYGGAGQ